MIALLFCISISILVVCLLYCKKARFRHIILLGFLMRIAFLTVDMGTSYKLIHASGDAEGFHGAAMHNASELSFTKIHYTNYPVFLAIIYTPFNHDNPRLLGQFCNILFGLATILVLIKCMALFEVPDKAQKIAVALAALSPNFAILQSLLLREAWIHLFVALSLLFFLRWFKAGGLGNMALCGMALLAAAWMHSGTIAIGLGYAAAFILYRPEAQRVKFTAATILPLLFVALGVAYFFAHLDQFGTKFVEMEENEDFIEEKLSSMRWEGGNTDYLTWIEVSSLSEGFAYLPLRMLYFMFSPMPTDWRGAGDMIAFLIDSCLYIWLLWKIFRSRRLSPVVKRAKAFLLTAIIAMVMVFSFGTRNSGTAMRHRDKIFSIVLATYALSQCKTNTERQEKRQTIKTEQ